jgi:hypothetical protein
LGNPLGGHMWDHLGELWGTLGGARGDFFPGGNPLGDYGLGDPVRDCFWDTMPRVEMGRLGESVPPQGSWGHGFPLFLQFLLGVEVRFVACG